MDKPKWIKVKAPKSESHSRMRSILKRHGLKTVCTSARCPNMGECWEQGTATFMILGDTCTRRCKFCSVNKGTPAPPDRDEPRRLAEVVGDMGLNHAVITSVTRDDLADGGASLFADIIRILKRSVPMTSVEVLIPDFGGSKESLKTVIDERPDILGHNMETVHRLYGQVRRGANYARSLRLLNDAKEAGLTTKSGFMVGLGETKEEVLELIADLKGVSCDILTIGQYLQPDKKFLSVVEYIRPEIFDQWKSFALELGFRQVASGPLVRSSYHAAEMVPELSTEVAHA
ncbi:MAG: lipoyl synthase [Candidatus Omnitrophica bacterium]|nr:lipoyl synthase [Candidatus Omnitrophota bacterium]